MKDLHVEIKCEIVCKPTEDKGKFYDILERTFEWILKNEKIVLGDFYNNIGKEPNLGRSVDRLNIQWEHTSMNIQMIEI